MTGYIDVMLEPSAQTPDIAAVAAAFTAAGIQAEVSAVYARRSADLLPWVIIIGGGFLPWVFLKAAAVQGAGDEAGRDGSRALMRLVTALYEARKDSRAKEGTVSIEPSGVREWIAPGILEALIPGRMQSHACTAEVPR